MAYDPSTGVLRRRGARGLASGAGESSPPVMSLEEELTRRAASAAEEKRRKAEAARLAALSAGERAAEAVRTSISTLSTRTVDHINTLMPLDGGVATVNEYRNALIAFAGTACLSYLFGPSSSGSSLPAFLLFSMGGAASFLLRYTPFSRHRANLNLTLGGLFLFYLSLDSAVYSKLVESLRRGIVGFMACSAMQAALTVDRRVVRDADGTFQSVTMQFVEPVAHFQWRQLLAQCRRVSRQDVKNACGFLGGTISVSVGFLSSGAGTCLGRVRRGELNDQLPAVGATFLVLSGFVLPVAWTMLLVRLVMAAYTAHQLYDGLADTARTDSTATVLRAFPPLVPLAWAGIAHLLYDQSAVKTYMLCSAAYYACRHQIQRAFRASRALDVGDMEASFVKLADGLGLRTPITLGTYAPVKQAVVRTVANVTVCYHFFKAYFDDQIGKGLFITLSSIMGIVYRDQCIPFVSAVFRYADAIPGLGPLMSIVYMFLYCAILPVIFQRGVDTLKAAARWSFDAKARPDFMTGVMTRAQWPTLSDWAGPHDPKKDQYQRAVTPPGEKDTVEDEALWYLMQVYWMLAIVVAPIVDFAQGKGAKFIGSQSMMLIGTVASVFKDPKVAKEMLGRVDDAAAYLLKLPVAAYNTLTGQQLQHRDLINRTIAAVQPGGTLHYARLTQSCMRAINGGWSERKAFAMKVGKYLMYLAAIITIGQFLYVSLVDTGFAQSTWWMQALSSFTHAIRHILPSFVEQFIFGGRQPAIFGENFADVDFWEDVASGEFAGHVPDVIDRFSDTLSKGCPEAAQSFFTSDGGTRFFGSFAKNKVITLLRPTIEAACGKPTA